MTTFLIIFSPSWRSKCNRLIASISAATFRVMQQKPPESERQLRGSQSNHSLPCAHGVSTNSRAESTDAREGITS